MSAADGQAVIRPNILWFIVDDMSANFSCYGEQLIQTPHVDQLAAEGTRVLPMRLSHNASLFTVPLRFDNGDVPNQYRGSPSPKWPRLAENSVARWSRPCTATFENRLAILLASVADCPRLTAAAKNGAREH